VGLVETATRLILAKGRTVTMKKLSRTPVDSDKPWRATGTIADPVVTTTAPAVLIDYARGEIDGEIIKAGDMKALVAPITDVDLEGYNVFVDSDGVEWAIVGVKPVKPGITLYLYKLQLRHE